MTTDPATHVAFAGYDRIARGTLSEVARHTRIALDRGESRPIAVFERSTSAPVDLDLRGTPEEVATRAATLLEGRAPPASRGGGDEGAGLGSAGPEKKGPGRPKLGVVGREVTLLPRHWDWLAAQPGGASVTLRKLVEAARKANQGSSRIRRTQDLVYRFMHAIGGSLPDFEEATRALYRWDIPKLEGLIQAWPGDVREHILHLVGGED